MTEASTITDDELDHYRNWTGRRTTSHDEVSPDVVRRFAAAIDRPLPADGMLPQMWHYGLFLNDVPTAQLGPDGHPPRGGAVPPVRLPRRMFAGSEMTFHAPMQIGVPATCVSEVMSVDRRKGSRGDLVLVRVADEITQGATLCVTETRTIVYLDAGAPIPAVHAAASPSTDPQSEIWTPDSVALFRFSAVTFNAHRIHYDRAYATSVEGYPDLVVHGPFTAVRLCDFAGRMKGALLGSFTFRGEAPLFCAQAIGLTVTGRGAALGVAAMRCDGKTAMTATAR